MSLSFKCNFKEMYELYEVYAKHFKNNFNFEGYERKKVWICQKGYMAVIL